MSIAPDTSRPLPPPGRPVLPVPTPVVHDWPLPAPRGPLGAVLLAHLVGTGPASGDDMLDATERALAVTGETRALLDDEDVQLSLACIYELTFRGVAGVDEAMEDDPVVAVARRRLETAMDRALHDLVDEVAGPLPAESVMNRLWDISAPSATPGFGHRMARTATLEQHRELLVHRSLYQLREADPHSFAIGRLPGAAKRTLLAVQWDEYGSGDLALMHSELFATTMRALGLSDRLGHYIDQIPAMTLALLNILSMYTLQRRHVGRLMGTLCAMEMTSTLPMKQYRTGLRRLGVSEEATAFHTEHVEVDAVHEQLMVRQFVPEFLADEPGRGAELVFGAAAFLAVEDLMFERMAAHWDAGRSSLRYPLA